MMTNTTVSMGSDYQEGTRFSLTHIPAIIFIFILVAFAALFGWLIKDKGE